MARDQTGVDMAACEGLVCNKALQEVDVGRDADHLTFGERGAQLPQRLAAVFAPCHQLGDHRIVVLADLVALRARPMSMRT